MMETRDSEDALMTSPDESPQSTWGRARRGPRLYSDSAIRTPASPSRDGRTPLHTSSRIFHTYGTVSPMRSHIDDRRSSNDVADEGSVSPPGGRLPGVLEENNTDADTYINGIRFWYSTFTSIDWLHDSIKGSARALRLRNRRSLTGRIINAWDRSLGWIVVTIVGILTALTAFIIVRLEQWLFDIKEGYCTDGWWKAKRFCCQVLGENYLTSDFHCGNWSTWAERFDGPQPSVEAWWIEYVTYGFFALILALGSAWLTVHFTPSTSFGDSNEASALTSGSMKKTVPLEANPGSERSCTSVCHEGYLGAQTLLIKGIGLSMSVASGLTLGKEGPFVHIASCWGNIISRWFVKYELNEAKRREILSAACAAGVAVAFGAPVGGVLFSLEEVSYFFPAKVMWRSFFCATVATVTLRFLDPFGTGKLVLFQVTYDKDWHTFELLPFLILGVFGGLYGAYFTKLHVLWVRHVRSSTWFRRYLLLEVLIVTIITTMLCFLNPYTRMGGPELVYNLFSECHVGGAAHKGLCLPRNASVSPLITAIGATMVIKAALTIVTFGMRLPAGLFVPTLGVGACFGRILGIGIGYLQVHHQEYPMFGVCSFSGDDDCVIPGLYAMESRVGAAAALSGVTRTTISLAVIVFELTGTMTYVVPVMLSVLVAKTVADFFQPSGIYDSVIELAQLPYLDCKHDYLWGPRTLHDIVNYKAEVIRTDKELTVRSLLVKLNRISGLDTGLPVLVKEGHSVLKVVGYIGYNELEHALSLVGGDLEAACYFRQNFTPSGSLVDEITGRDPYDFTVFMDQAPLSVNINTPLEAVHQMFTKLGARYVIINNVDGHYEGVLDKKAWIGFVNGIPRA
ncbi:chloride channel [Cantharellus anzutake]|uniref:chloride channel n=1 Tax=Cantharellus anzutake TaxID=1750568 RepID=UPI0019053210|nr:chloride channel [Cantharellus anzutake]KAF8325186.1 chloride channel [Cantharellus anzutake]